MAGEPQSKKLISGFEFTLSNNPAITDKAHSNTAPTNMAPTTRRQQKQRQSMEDESAAATEANGARIDKAAGKAKQNGHKRFDSKDEDEEETIAVSGGVALGEGKEARNDDSEEEGREDDSDDDAPEAVTMGSGRVAAKKREEDAKKAIEL